MKKAFNFYSAIYTVHLVLNIACIVLVYKYYELIDIPNSLLAALPYEMAQIIIIFIVWALLFAYFIAALVFLIKSIKEGKSGTVEKSTKLATLILPLVFVCSLSMAAIPMGTMKTKGYVEADLAVADFFDNFDEKEYYTVCEKNSLGKACSYERNCYIENERSSLFGNDTGKINFECIYQQSKYKFVRDKFEGYAPELYQYENAENFDGYSVYYRQNDNRVLYSLIKDDENGSFIATFESYDNNYLNDYTRQQFIDDSLSIYNEWQEF